MDRRIHTPFICCCEPHPFDVTERAGILSSRSAVDTRIEEDVNEHRAGKPCGGKRQSGKPRQPVIWIARDCHQRNQDDHVDRNHDDNCIVRGPVLVPDRTKKLCEALAVAAPRARTIAMRCVDSSARSPVTEAPGDGIGSRVRRVLRGVPASAERRLFRLLGQPSLDESFASGLRRAEEVPPALSLFQVDVGVVIPGEPHPAVVPHVIAEDPV